MYSRVVQKLDDYIDGRSSKQEYEEWLYDLAFDVEQTCTRRVVLLVQKLEGILAESSSGNWLEASLKRELSRISQEAFPRVIVVRQIPDRYTFVTPPAVEIHFAAAM